MPAINAVAFEGTVSQPRYGIERCVGRNPVLQAQRSVYWACERIACDCDLPEPKCTSLMAILLEGFVLAVGLIRHRGI